eukprot:TRINITY_DN7244_c0_g2_i1.p2 TRINITY_DN7244_c0_g2~~TRINITY_DN7244_c0_g2_i1.p2  ORF type:complete len:233 (-),score=49.36 TRINITY_DN7244_c0_g2_i1:15-713(-)
MDFQHRAGSRPGAGPLVSREDANMERRERMKRLAMDTIDISKDPYIIKNHLGTYECRLCLTLHSTEASYLAHTQGRKHQTNLAKRQSKDMKDTQAFPQPKLTVAKRRTVKIGRPGYKVTKQRETETNQKSLMFELDYPQIEPRIKPRFRLMSSYEQRHEQPDDRFQYLLIAAEPYETIGFKIPNVEIDFSEDKHFTYWDDVTHKYTLQITFKNKQSGAHTVNPSIGPQTIQK